MAEVLLLGAQGFIGRHVGGALRGRAGVTLVEGTHRQPGEAPGSRIRLDLAGDDRATIVAALDRAHPGVIVNCVGRTSGTTPQLTVANVVTMARLLDALESVAWRPRLIHVGSAAEYGRGPAGTPVTEDAVAAPVSAYGASKLVATQLVRLAREQGIADGSVLRVFNVVGAGMSTDTLPGTVARELVRAVEARAGSIQTGPLDTVRDFIDVNDVAEAIASAALATDLPPPVLNVGSGRGIATRDLVEELARQAGFSGAIAEKSAGSTRSAGVPWQVADIGLAVATLGWQPSRTLEAMCRSVLGAGPGGSDGLADG